MKDEACVDDRGACFVAFYLLLPDCMCFNYTCLPFCARFLLLCGICGSNLCICERDIARRQPPALPRVQSSFGNTPQNPSPYRASQLAAPLEYLSNRVPILITDR